MRLAVSLAVLLLAAGCSNTAATVPAKAAPNAKAAEIAAALQLGGVKVAPDVPSSCAACHTAIVAEWQESMHARSHHASDPIYGGLRALRLQKQGPEVAQRCSLCHNPRDLAAPESEVAHTGVSCAACHELASVKPDPKNPGAASIARGDPGVLRGARDVADGVSPVHGNGRAAPELKDGRTLCLACHGREENQAGVATCTTGDEYAGGGSTESCVSCHMPEVAAPSGPVVDRLTHRSHQFVGPHRAWLQNDPSLFAKALAITGRFERERFVASLANRSAHGFPSGFPARLAVVVLRGLDTGGAEIWRNVKLDPMQDHPEAVLNKVYLDADGKPALAPFSVKLARDNRLKGGETREIGVAIPASVARVEVVVKFWLVAPMAAKATGVEALPEAQPRAVLTASFARP